MTYVYHLTPDLSDGRWLRLNESDQVLSDTPDLPDDWTVNKRVFVALPGRVARAVDVLFPTRVRAVLPAVQFALETSLSDPLAEQCFFLQRYHYSHRGSGFVLTKRVWQQVLAQINTLPVAPRAVYPDYLWLPYVAGQITVAQEGAWCRVRYGQHDGCCVSLAGVSLLLNRLVTQDAYDTVLIYTDGSATVAWSTAVPLPVVVLRQSAPWSVADLPKPARCHTSSMAVRRVWQGLASRWVSVTVCLLFGAACVFGLSMKAPVWWKAWHAKHQYLNKN